MLALLAFAWPLRGLAVTVGPAEVTGNLGYNYRLLRGPDDSKTASNQFLINLRANSYIWQPWFATAEGGLTLMRDAASVSKANPDSGLQDSSSNIVTGEFNLNLLPQSRSPFSMRYLTSNSRVDMGRISSAPVTFTNLEFDTRRLELRQSYLTEQNDRFLFRYDTAKWSSVTDGSYDDSLLGVEMDMRRSKQNLLVKLSQGTTEHSLSRLRNESLIFDLSHFYTASPALRVDTKASYYNFDRSFRVTSASATSGSSTTNIAQASTFVFWRPEASPLSLSGGVRAFKLDGNTPLDSNSSLNLSANLGGFYQYSKRLRLDGSAAVTATDSNGVATRISRQQAGVLYQSDIMDLFKGSGTYQWYATGSADNQTDKADNQLPHKNESRQSVYATLAHNGQKTWLVNETSSVRLSLGQSLNGFYRFGGSDTITAQQDHQGTVANRQFAGIASANTRLDHTGTVAWSQSDSGTSTVQTTLSDSRSLSDTKDNQQLANFQVMRTQPINRLSFLSGNLTVQYVRQDFPGLGPASNITTATGRIDYQHSSVLGITNLRFLSNLFVSRSATQQGIDRSEWDNRLDYAIGLLDASLSLRLIQIDGQNSNLLLFRIARRF